MLLFLLSFSEIFSIEKKLLFLICAPEAAREMLAMCTALALLEGDCLTGMDSESFRANRRVVCLALNVQQLGCTSLM